MAHGISVGLLGNYFQGNRFERIWLLARTDFKLRYSASVLGLFWAFVYPLVRILIYYIVFSYFFAKEIPNYGFYIFSGIILWMYFQEATKKGMNSIKSKLYLLENIRVNKLDIFYSTILTSLIGFMVNLAVLVLLMLVFGLSIQWRVIYYPVFIINLMLLSLGVSLILSTISVYFKDISQLWDMVLLLMFWINPIFFAKQKIFNMFPALLYANPLAGIIINSRDVLVYGKEPDWLLVGYNFFYAFVILGVGLLIFNKYFHKAIEKI